MGSAPRLLSVEELRKELPQFWVIVNNMNEPKIQRIYNLKKYADCVSLVSDLGKLADEMDHHPEILLTYGSVKVEIFTHSLNGISNFDLEYAKSADRLFELNF
ncbi:4a-hydroxytetrahydrobiopterin dehydratase [Leptospira semungkisensis]|uniref:4a-hydroxytetrahydrobiopterin dehydratase n=1 Tax=Leptospira semungkisensis TaxID=2484985 RepID=A0A4R9FXT7_9LEPT|nr:4a-hydroxytetrahydrobiopterin dehydratase [Leptospira semungkisensis]TGK03828.1 4a-hydroxytetrahydrobiopterin dehydratase [Leptospira semungkisensis]